MPGPGPTELQGFQIEDGSISLAKLSQSGAAIGDAPLWNGTNWAPGPVSGGGGGTANALATTGLPVGVSGAAPPTAGQVLTAIDATHASWQTPSAGGGTLDSSYDFGGSGAGRTIIVDAGAIQFFGNGADNNNVFEIQKIPGAPQSGNAVDITLGANASGIGIHVSHSGTGLGALFSGSPISVPGAGAQSERFGASTTASGTHTLAAAFGAQATGKGSVALGYLTFTSDDNLDANASSVAIGLQAKAGFNGVHTGTLFEDLIAIGGFASAGNGPNNNANCIAIGELTVAGAAGATDNHLYTACIAIGDFSTAGGTGAGGHNGFNLIAIGEDCFAQGLDDCIAIGDACSAGTSATDADIFVIGDGATGETGKLQLVIGSAHVQNSSSVISLFSSNLNGFNNTFMAGGASGFGGTQFTDVYFGSGFAPSPLAYKIHGSEALNQPNHAGAELGLGGGRGTGTAVGGDTAFYYSPPGIAGSAFNPYVKAGFFSGQFGWLTVPGATGAANTERFGSTTTANGAGSTVVGHGATSTTFLQAMIAGFGAQGLGDNSVSIGASSTAAFSTTTVGHGALGSAFDSVAVGSLANVDSISISSVAVGTSAHCENGSGAVAIGNFAHTLNGQSIAIGQFSVGNGQYSIGIGWEADAFAYSSIGIGGRARTYTTDRITHAITQHDHTFVSGHLFYEKYDAFFGGGIQCPTTSGRFAQAPPNFTMHGTGGQTWTTIAEPFNEGFNGSAFTASATSAIGGVLSGTYLVAIGLVNKERNGETLLTSPFAVLVTGGNNAILIANLAAVVAVDPQIEEVLIYMENAPGSGNLYLQASSTGFSVTLTQPPSIFSVPGYLGYPAGGEVVTGGQVTTPDASAQITANSTISAGNGWMLGLAGGDSDDAALAGGNITFSTNRTGAAHTLTLAGYFNAADGTLSVPGAGSQSERFGLNAIADAPDSVAIGFNAQALSPEGDSHSVVIGSGAQSNGSNNVGIGYNCVAGSNAIIAVGTALTVSASSTVLISTASDTIPGTLGGVIAIQDGAQAAWGGNGDITVIGRFNDFSAVTGNDILAVGRSIVFTGTNDILAIGRSIAAGTSGTDFDLIGVGHDVTVSGQHSVAIGHSSQALGDKATALGDTAFAKKLTVAVGYNAQTPNANSGDVAIGPNSAAGNAAQVVFPGAGASFDNFAFGDTCLAGTGTGKATVNIAIGGFAVAGLVATPGIASDCIAIGDGCAAGSYNPAVTFTYSDCIVIGDGAQAGADTYGTADCIAIGDGSTSSGLHDCVGIGDGAVAGNSVTDFDCVAIGDGPAAWQGNSLIAIGRGPNAMGQDGISIGHTNNVGVANSTATQDNICIGHSGTVANSTGDNNCIGIGKSVNIANGNNLIGLGNAVTIGGTASECIAIGHAASAGAASNTSECIAIGHSANAGGGANSARCIAIGHSAQAGGVNNTDLIAIGDGANTGVSGGPAIVIGSSASTLDANNGNHNNVFVVGSIASPITDIYFGSGISSTGSGTPSAYTIHGSGGSATTNTTGANINIAAGIGFAAGSQGGEVHIKVALDGAATTLVDAMFWTRNASTVQGTAGLLTTATDGFLYIESCAGPPTGVPTAFSNRVPMVYDRTNNNLYIYNGGWKKTTTFA